ncbi:MAG TPA: hypothetical protein VHW70_07005 [Edaphobacter sp.]|jgi:hypothetical protein|nr:hypothetical protein [Edaphobacter sp.]
MHLDPRLLRAAALGLILIVLYGTRMTKGSVTKTADGLVFGIKPIILWMRIVILPALIIFYIYFWRVSKQSPPIWVPLLFFAAIVFLLAQMPGIIALSSTAITQRFWFRQSKTIQYSEIMAIQSAQGGRITRVLGDNRVRITHTSNHCAAEEFRQELERRTGKRVVA